MNYPGSLHNHTDYSNLRLRDSIEKIEDLINRSIELNQEVIAITEHETVSNAIKVEKYYKKIKEKNPNFKVILGNEIYLCRDGLNLDNFVVGEDKYYHWILLAKNAQGHEQIRELSTRAWKRSYKQGIMTRVPTYYQDLIDIIGANPGNVIGSTACLGGFLPNKILLYNNKPSQELYDNIINWCLSMQSIFGQGNFYLEMQPSDAEEQIIVNKFLLKLSQELNIPYIITTDSHYLTKEDRPIHKAYLNSQDGDREVDEFYATTYLMDDEEIRSYFSYFTADEIEQAYINILNIKNACEDYSLLRPLKIPSLDWKEPTIKTIPKKYFDLIPNLSLFYNSDFNGDVVLAQMIVSKIESDIKLQNQKVYDEVNQNLDSTWQSSLVNNTHWSAYFLNLQKIIDVCWDSGTLVGPGRGSGVGFILLYLLDIIQINPLWETTKCFSWRFLNPDRVSVLDIDTDIEGGKRAQVLQGLRDYYGEDRVANVITFGTEKSKSAIQTAARGLGIDNDVSLYLASLIPADRGQTRTLQECFYGDEEKDFAPVYEFVHEMTNNYPELWQVAQRIEGLVCRMGEHAGGVIFVDEDFTKSTALLRVPNGDLVTQFDLHDSEDASLIKIDLLSVECLDKIHNCLDLLAEYGYINKDKTLRERYEDTIGIYNLERTNPKMWEMVWNHDIQSLFQMEKQSGVQGISLIHPKSVDELAVLNSVIRLMASEKGGEQPLAMWARYREDISGWLYEMKRYGLTQEEIDWLSHHSAVTDGICESQEGLMSLVQEERLGGNNLSFADKCRKGIAKKQGKLFQECEDIYYENIKKNNCSEKLAHYVWDVLLKVQRGYSFNRSHCLAYSLVALQEMNLCFKFPIIFWNCACLITDSGTEDSGTNYDKIASAIGKMRSAGINITLPDINKSEYGFKPDVVNNSIFCGFKSLNNVGNDVVNNIINNRPYESPRDFINKVNPNKQAMVSLIKGGAFDNMMDRKLCMGWYLWETCDKKKKLNLQNMASLIKYQLIPAEEDEAKRIYEFTRYLKAICKYTTTYYKLDQAALDFLAEMGYDDIVEIENGQFILNIKTWDKVYQGWMDSLRLWISNNQEALLKELNKTIFKEEWDKYATGNLSSWEMEALCFYYHEHELSHINNGIYGFADFYALPQDPVVDSVYHRGNKEINIFRLYKLCGTCIAKNKNKSTISLLTTNGVVNVKFRKEYFAMFDKQISQRDSDGVKHVVEKSWFNRGSKLVVMGIRSGDDFITKKYANTNGHQLAKIESLNEDGLITLKTTRALGEEDDV